MSFWFEEAVYIPVDDITIPDNASQLDQELVGKLAESIERVGLLNPIVIGCDRVLLNGRHRLEAYRKLGRHVIAAVAVGSSVEAQRHFEQCRIEEKLFKKYPTQEELDSLASHHRNMLKSA
ncbi:ParB N-terminal domain-containing protein [Dongshaea marina]|uniref:ParB N-terminal domain-containing protein n=1 Tax=Dongshaea marina TaxID=2047966 RepID=UPI000D3E72DD|nr:ParB N-terminal domain-containing protein [Dongshaea marina]